VNVVAVVVVLVMLIPIYFAQRLAGGGEALGRSGRGGDPDDSANTVTAPAV